MKRSILTVLIIIISIATADAQLKIETVTHFGRTCFKVTTPWAVLYFENHDGSSGFKSVFDNQGKDWLQAGHGWGANQEFRGFPNATDGNFGHASRGSSSVNTISKNTPTHIIINSKNAKMEFNYHFFTSHGAIEVIRAGEPYCFLWEGTNGGSVDAGDYFITSDGVKRTAGTERNTLDDIPDEWLYFGDPALNDVFIMGMRPDDNLLDENWRRFETFELYSFGRGSGKVNQGGTPWGPRVLSGTKNYYVYSFVKKTKTHEEMKTFINGLFANPYVNYSSTAVKKNSIKSTVAPVMNVKMSIVENSIRVTTPTCDDLHLELFTISGECLARAIMNSGSATIDVPVSGMYYLHLQDGIRDGRLKVIVP